LVSRIIDIDIHLGTEYDTPHRIPLRESVSRKFSPTKLKQNINKEGPKWQFSDVGVVLAISFPCCK
jgi:hypothetical protein